MKQLEPVLAKIRSGPQGPKVGAFFDFDGTVIEGYSAAEYIKTRIRRRQMGVRELAKTLAMPFRQNVDEETFATVFGDMIQPWIGLREEALRELWWELYFKRIARLMYFESYCLVREHIRAGHTVAIASSATRYQIEPVAEEFGIEHILATQLQVKHGVINGKIEGVPLWREHKAAAVGRFARRNGIRLRDSYGYANGDEDIPFLAALGAPTAVNPQQQLEQHAAQHKWPVLTFAPRKKAPIKAVAGTVGAYSTMTAAMLAGMAYNRLYNEPRRAADMIGTVGSEIGLAIAGIKVEIINEHNLWRARPAVFILNHQSKLDFFIFYNIIRRELTGVVKKEAEKVPIIGPFLRMAEMSFLDRSNTQSAIDALKPAVDRLKRGLSVAISPEGTRSYTPRVGKFKKGAFHIARQAGVPIVPVVIRNAGELMWREDHAMRGGVVEICVLDPIDVSDWRDDTMEEHIAAVRQQFIDTLENWPATQTGGEASTPGLVIDGNQ